MIDALKDWIADLLARLPLGWFRESPPRVGVIRFEGVIGGSRPGRAGMTLQSYQRVISSVFARRGLSAVAIIVNSPGGSPVQSSLIAQRIRNLAEEKQVPVIAFCEDVAASGGYWLACAADEIYVDSNSLVGSIGVIFAGFGFADLLERAGIERRVHASGHRKGMLDPFQEENTEHVERLRELQSDIFDSFRDYVRKRRGDRLPSADDALFTGDIWTGRQACEIGLADGIAELRTEMRRRLGDKVRFHHATIKRGMVSRLRRGLTVTIEPAEIVAALDEWALWQRFKI